MNIEKSINPEVYKTEFNSELKAEQNDISPAEAQKEVEETKNSLLQNAEVLKKQIEKESEEIINDPEATKEEKEAAKDNSEKAEKLKSSLEETYNWLRKGLDRELELKSGWEKLSERDKKIVKNFDPQLEPIKRLIPAEYNNVILCEHPKYGKVVFKISTDRKKSMAESKDFLRTCKEKNIKNVYKLIETEETKKKEGMLTKYIEGSDLDEIILNQEPWELKDGIIYYKGKELTNQEKIIKKLRDLVKKLHELNRAGFDLRAKNIRISSETGEPYLGDFELMYGGNKKAEIKKVIQELIEYPLDVIVNIPIEFMFNIKYALSQPKKFLKNAIPDLPDLKLKNYHNKMKQMQKYDFQDIDELFDLSKLYGSNSQTALLLDLYPGDPRTYS